MPASHFISSVTQPMRFSRAQLVGALALLLLLWLVLVLRLGSPRP